MRIGPSLMALVIALAGLSHPRSTYSEDNWPQFRGPAMNGVAEDDPALPDTWGISQNVEWVTEIPGLGWSNPIVWGERVFLTSVVAEGDFERPKRGLYLGGGRPDPPDLVHSWRVYALDLQSGEIVWEQTAHEAKPVVSRHPKSTYASETPTTDGERVYALFGDVGLYCFSMEGEPLWETLIEPQKTRADYGAAASPIVHEGQVIMVYDNEQSSYIAAFDSRTGRPLWRTERDEVSTWATPFLWENDRRSEIVTAGQNRIRSYDLEGTLLWSMDGRMSRLTIPTPFAAHGMLYITSGYIGDNHRPLYAILPGASGDITLAETQSANRFIAWYQPKLGPYNPSTIVHGDYYYTLLDRGFFTCNDARTGEEVYGRQRIDPGASFTASPVAYNDKIFCLSEEGDTYVIQAGPEYKLLGKNSLEELCLASPAVSQGRVLIRTASKLYSIKR